MRKASDLRRRVDELAALMGGTIAAKLAKLTPAQRIAYDQWRSACAVHFAANPGADAYARLIDGDAPPPLRHDVHIALFGATIGIPADATDAQASEIYRSAALGD